MLIRNQKKTELVNLSNVADIRIEPDFTKGMWRILCKEINGNILELGRYAGSRTQEVIDSIVTEYVKPTYHRAVSDKETEVYENKFYQMPEN